MSANNPLYPALPLYDLGAGIKTDFGTMLPPGTRVTYVRSTGVQSGDPQSIAARLLTTINAACAECRSGMGDIVYVLPGHTENITGANFLSNLVAGTRIIGLGDVNRSGAPTLNWTATASQIAISVANVEISGMRLLMDGANGVVKAMNITGAGCRLTRNYMRWSSGAALLATIAIEVGSGATDCLISQNYVTGLAAGVVTNGINVVGATVPSRLSITSNNFQVACAAATGCINVTVAALNCTIANNILSNLTAASAAVITLANVASTGIIADNYMAILADGTPPVPIVFGASAVWKCFQNFCSDQANRSGLLLPAVIT